MCPGCGRCAGVNGEQNREHENLGGDINSRWDGSDGDDDDGNGFTVVIVRLCGGLGDNELKRQKVQR